MGRYIDANLLKNRIYEHKRIAIHKDDIVRIISDIPIADVEKVRHGSWKRANDNGWKSIYDDWVCSECGYTNDFSNKKLIDKLHFFCPHCGAKMDL